MTKATRPLPVSHATVRSVADVDLSAARDAEDVIDLRVVAQSLAPSDPALAQKIAVSLTADFATLLPMLHAEGQELRRALHNLIALAGTVGADRLSAQAHAAQIALKSGDPALCRPLCADLIRRTRALIERLEGHTDLTQGSE